MSQVCPQPGLGLGPAGGGGTRPRLCGRRPGGTGAVCLRGERVPEGGVLPTASSTPRARHQVLQGWSCVNLTCQSNVSM